ncbi:MAG: CidA/LrgA family protein [Lachnospiraceae bacterium]|nr:CidA/LrgA family protein [Lachnospiraceae bacterium]
MKLLKQLGIIFGICLVGEGIAAILPISFPASVISMFLMLLLLIAGILKMEHVKEAAEYLIQNMAFFFIPAGVAIMEKYDLVKGKILVLFVICVITLVLTFLAAAFTVKGVIRLQEKLRAKRGIQE